MLDLMVPMSLGLLAPMVVKMGLEKIIGFMPVFTIRGASDSKSYGHCWIGYVNTFILTPWEVKLDIWLWIY